MKKLIALFILSAAVFSFCEAARAEKTYVLPAVFNGKDWRRLANIDEEQSQTFKVCLIRGIYEGAFAIDPQNAYQQFGPWISYAELVKLLDRFYAEDRNLQIPVTYALVLTASPSKNKVGALQVAGPPDTEDPNSAGPLVSLESP